MKGKRRGDDSTDEINKQKRGPVTEFEASTLRQLALFINTREYATVRNTRVRVCESASVR